MTKNANVLQTNDLLVARDKQTAGWRWVQRANIISRDVAFPGRNRPQIPTITLIIPAFNEASNLPHVLSRIPAFIDEIILVDGDSSDNTVATARKLCPDIRIVVQQGKGKGDALRAGFREANGDILVMIDADGSTAPEEIPDHIRRLKSGYDVVKGSRFLKGGASFDITFLRRLGNRAFVLLLRFLFGGTYSDICYGFVAFWKDVLPCLKLDRESEYFGFEVEALIGIRAIQNQLRVAEVPSIEKKRINGSSRLQVLRDGWRILKIIVREWSPKPRFRMS